MAKDFVSASQARKAKDVKLQASAEKTKAEQPLPVDIFPKDEPTKFTVEKLWAGGDHKKAVLTPGAVPKLLKAFPADADLINETAANVRSA